MKLVFWFAVLVVAAALALFAVSNREAVALEFWPLPFILEVPLYLVLLATLLAGFVVGALSGWNAGRRARREARRRGRRVATLERELAATQAQLPAPSAAQS